MTLTLVLLGCAAQRQQLAKDQGLKMRISALEEELQQKNTEIRELESQLEEMRQESISSAPEEQTRQPQSGRPKASSRNVQLALKNAGYYVGPIDGKIGKKTRVAIKQFQKEKGLTADGVVGKQTWLKLMKYL